MIPKRAQQEVIELALEDYTPLFDVTGVIKRFMPEKSVDEHIEIAGSLLRYLLCRGYIKFYYDCLATSNGEHRDAKELTAAEIEEEMRDRANWRYHDRREPDERWVTIGATKEGERALLAGEFFGG